MIVVGVKVVAKVGVKVEVEITEVLTIGEEVV